VQGPGFQYGCGYETLIYSWALVGHACNPGYSGGRDLEDCGLKPAQANSLRDPISKKPHHAHKKRAGGVAQGVGPEFKPQTAKKKKKVYIYIYDSVGFSIFTII
jgi:hypothetical protein